jgi:adenylate cyclase
MSMDPSSQNLRHLESITAVINDAIIAADGRGRILSWNGAAEEIFKYSAGEALGKPVTIIIPERFKRPHEAGIERVRRGGPHRVIGKTVELMGVRKDGVEIPIELSLSTWKIGEARFFGGIIRDISERKRAEAALVASEQKFRSIAESASDAIVSADAQGRVMSWNRAAQNIFGYTPAEVLRQPLTLIIPERFRKAHEGGVRRAAAGGKHNVIGKTVELAGLHKDGREIPIELSLSTWDVDGAKFFCGIIRDITERKRAEDELRQRKEQLADQARKLKRANAEVRKKNDQLQALSNKLAKYLSRQVYNSIFQGKKDVRIESYRKKLTVFFSDIEGFTELGDRLESEALTSMLNKYLNEMSTIALEFGGTIDKYIGDAIMIFFGDPDTLGEKQDALACVKMALKMRRRMAELRREWESLGISTPLRVRMGINTGFCTVGNFGSEERLDYTIVGTQVNLASRLESMADPGEILLSHSAYLLVRDEIACEPKGEIKLKGLAYPVRSYGARDVISKASAEEERLKAALAGFRLSIDFHKLSYADKIAAKEVLEKAITKLK